MRSRSLFCSVLMLGALSIDPSLAKANHIFATVDGNNVDNAAGHDACGLGGDPYLALTDCNGTAQAYGRLVISGISPNASACSSANPCPPARIIVRTDSNQDYLTLVGSSIKTNLATGQTLNNGPLSLWATPLTQLPNTTTYGGDIGYELDVDGSFFRAGSKPVGDALSVSSNLKHPPDAVNWLAMRNYSVTMSNATCPQNNVPCVFSNSPRTPFNISPGFDEDRALKTDLSITIKSGDTLKIPDNSLSLKSTAPGGIDDNDSKTQKKQKTQKHN